MEVRAFREPCYFAEAVYLLYYFVNNLTYEDDYKRIAKSYSSRSSSAGSRTELQIRELARISELVTAGMNPNEERLRHFFAKLPGTDRKTCCCLAQVMLMAVPLNCCDIDEFADQLRRSHKLMQSQGIKINDINTMGLIMERWDGPGEPESLAAQVERLPCDFEARWDILRVLTDFDEHLAELTELIRPVAERLCTAMKPLNSMNEECFKRWSEYFSNHTVDDFQNEMFNTSFLFAEENVGRDIWLGIWNFNPFGSWSEWIETDCGMVRIAYIGICMSFDFAVKLRNRPDEEALSGMLRGLCGKDKLEILRRCAQRPNTAVRLSADMNLNSGTVSRILYDLFRLGYLETRGDGKRVNYVTKIDALERIFKWIIEYVSDAE